MESRYHFRKRIVPLLTSVLLLSLVFIASDCDESLPAIVEPSNVLSTDLSLKLGTAHLVLMLDGVTPFSDDGEIDVKVKNLYNEVLSDSESIEVQAVIFQTSHPERRDTVYAFRRDLQDFSVMLGNLVVIRPGQELEVVKQWSHTYNDTIPFWTVADGDSTITVSGGKLTLYRVQFTVSARVKIFKTRPEQIVNEKQFTVYYRFYGT